MITKIGIISGEILAVLETVSRPLKCQELTATLDQPNDEILMSIGWLIREGYVQVESVNGHSLISLNPEKKALLHRNRLVGFDRKLKTSSDRGPKSKTDVPPQKRQETINLSKMYRDFVETVPCGIYLTDALGDLIYVNQAFIDMLGYADKSELLGVNLANELYMNPQDWEAFLSTIEEKGWVCDYEVKTVRKDGKVVILSKTSRLLQNAAGQTIGIEGIVRNITEKKRQEEQLRVENAKLEHILSLHEEISSILKLEELVDFIINKAIEILDVQRCSLMLLDNNTKELSIKGAHGLSEDIIQDTRVKLGEQIAGLVALYGTPLLVNDMDKDSPFIRKSRPSYNSKSFISVPIKLERKIIGVVNVAGKGISKNDIFTQTDLRILSAIVRQAAVAIENANLYRELKYLSITDSLTGLYNHRHFVKSLDQEIKRLKRYPGSMCLMMIDVDHFKSYNDTFGHQEGDLVIREVSSVLRKNLREIDLACRYGGDEFAVILLETKVFKAEIVAKKFQKAMENLEFKKKITLSIGIAAYSNNNDRHELIVKADRALYQSKKEGRDRISIYG